MAKKLPISAVEIRFRVRYQTNEPTIDEYTKSIKDGAEMPAIDVFCEKGSQSYVLADGEHRLLAHNRAGKSSILCEIHEGDEKDALKFALKANANHGLRRTNADKRQAILLALNEEDIASQPLRTIADMCNVSHEAVRKVQIELDERVAQQEGDDEDEKPKKKKPSKGERDRDEFRGAVNYIRTLPYPGNQRPVGFTLDDDDIEHVTMTIGYLIEVWETETGKSWYDD